MKIIRRNRKFVVGKLKEITLTDKGSIYLNNNDNITFHYNKKINYDIAKKNWGFYPLPSINKRLKRFKLNAVLVESRNFNTFFIMLVLDDKKKIKEFKKYCKKENIKIITWLNIKNLNLIKKIFQKKILKY
tara:strand:+ start:689 stop:1081 length:393 start_codon:yes stop_codon:yes gene_type:complete